jgi:hypothetical protein
MQKGEDELEGSLAPHPTHHIHTRKVSKGQACGGVKRSQREPYIFTPRPTSRAREGVVPQTVLG